MRQLRSKAPPTFQATSHGPVLIKLINQRRSEAGIRRYIATLLLVVLGKSTF